jgi:Tol biopolymer transport system component
MYTGEGRARVVNSIFFEEPPFFGFDIQPPEGWHHVVGVDGWAATDAELISPTINRFRQPRDGDRVLIHGHIQGNLITASYVGFGDGTFHYYRSLLHMDELRPGILPPVYDGLEVWVRGVLGSSEGQGQFYVLPEGTSFDPSYVGQEALVGGRLFISESIGVEVTEGIYVKDAGHYTDILEGEPVISAKEVQECGIIRSVDPSGHWLLLEPADGRSVEVNISEGTRIKFADGTEADPSELSAKRRIEVFGQASGMDRLSGTKVTIVGTTTEGPMYAAYIGGANGDLWSVSLDGRERRQITHLASPSQGLANAEISPDGLHFAFAHQQGPQSTLAVGDLQSGKLRQWLTGDRWQERAPAWSPDGTRLALCRYRVEGEQLIDGALWILTLKDGEVRRVTGPAAEGWRTVQPRWSPDGKFIAFGQVSDDPAQPAKLDVLSFPPQSQRIFEYGRDWRWSADSTQLLCTRQKPEEDRARIWVVQHDGSSPTWLSTTGVHDHYGRWSPDGTAIAFLSRPAGSSSPDYLWIMQADGMRRFRPESQPLASRVTWSPDSQAIVLMRVTASGENAGLWIVGRDGSELRELAADAVELVGTYRMP